MICDKILLVCFWEYPSTSKAVGLRFTTRKMGMVFQGSALFDSMNVLENVRFPLDMLTTIIDNKLDNLIGVLKYNIEDTKQHNTFNSLFDFGE